MDRTISTNFLQFEWELVDVQHEVLAVMFLRPLQELT